MAITFYDKQEAREYAQAKEDEGYVTSISEPSERVWKVHLWKKGHRKHSEQELIDKGIPPEHIISYYLPKESKGFEIGIKPEDLAPSHILTAHELAHQKLHHTLTPYDKMHIEEAIKQEEEAWELAAQSLKNSGEWNKEAKEIATRNLASYYNWRTEGDKEENYRNARDFINNL